MAPKYSEGDQPGTPGTKKGGAGRKTKKTEKPAAEETTGKKSWEEYYDLSSFVHDISHFPIPYFLENKKLVVPSYDGWRLSEAYPNQKDSENNQYDVIREFMGSYWHQHIPKAMTYGKMMKFDKFSKVNPGITGENYTIVEMKATEPTEFTSEEPTTAVFGRSKQQIYVQTDLQDFDESTRDFDLLGDLSYVTNTNAESLEYVDSCFFINRPSIELQKDFSSEGKKPASFVEFNPVYNFYLCDYEEKMPNAAWETYFPNAYFISKMIHLDSADTSKPPASNTSWYSAPHFVYQSQVYGNSKLSNGTLSFNNLNHYLTQLPKSIGDSAPDEKFYKHVLHSPKEEVFFNSVKENIDKFPMYMHISFAPIEGPTKFVDLLKQTEFFDPLVENVFFAEKKMEANIKNQAGNLTADFMNQEMAKEGITWTVDQALGKNIKIYDQENLETVWSVPTNTKAQYFNLTQWLGEIMKSLEGSDLESLKDFIYPYNQDFAVPFDAVSPTIQGFIPLLSVFDTEADGKTSALLQSLLFVIMKGKIKNYVKEHTRSYQEILEGKPAHSETLMYEIVKCDAQNLAEIQTIYLPHSTGIIEYLDTQITYEKEYIYKIYAHQIVFGTKYQYKGVDHELAQFPDGDFDWGVEDFKVEVEYEPEVLIYRIPYYNGEDFYQKRAVRVIDSPPLPPEVTFYPIKNSKNTVILAMNVSVGRQKMSPVLFSTARDEADNKEERLSRNGVIKYSYAVNDGQRGDFLSREIQSSETELEYETDDMRGVFEVYRTTQHPEKYEDFGEADLMAELDNRVQTVFTDESLVPNQKYYYTCRVRDAHDNISNPTPVYEVQLLDTGVGIYPSIKAVELAGEKKKQINPTKAFKKYLLIQPSLEQSSVSDIDEDTGEFLNDVHPTAKIGSEKVKIGDLERTVFAKKFKMRITSKRTGKKIDFNFGVKFEEKKESTSGEKC